MRNARTDGKVGKKINRKKRTYQKRTSVPFPLAIALS
jgi:hypothetical protein